MSVVGIIVSIVLVALFLGIFISKIKGDREDEAAQRLAVDMATNYTVT